MVRRSIHDDLAMLKEYVEGLAEQEAPTLHKFFLFRSYGERSQGLSFVLSLLLPGIAMVITQAAFNRLAVNGHLTPAQA